jgi:cyclomaltodextrinase / maltogenic alpha-amylase / neopullulanase
MAIYTPDWVKNAVFYQIFPDRFARSPRSAPPRGIQFKPWGSPPEQQGLHGGDLLGIVDKLDYLRALGVTALYLTPIFASASNHRYHTYDYYQVDPLVGGNAALRELLDGAHERGMRVVLDGVFNHASRGFWAFHHILENGANSPYLDWFIVRGWPLHAYPGEVRHPPNYECWWGLPALPKFNIHNPGVREYLLDVARHWIAFGADGWRLDVPTEIDDVSFWQAFRHVVKVANPDAYICAEIWHFAERWLQGDQFDAVMNYPFSRAVLGFCGAQTLVQGYRQGSYLLTPLTSEYFARQIDEVYRRYDWQVNYAQLNLLDSHDTARALWIMGNDKSALRLCVLCQMTMPGAPCIYYGDEIGMSAGKDPFCRAAFPWQDQGQWDHDLLVFYRRATTLRHRYPVLRTGTFQRLHPSKGMYAFARVLPQQCAVVIVNAQTTPAIIDVNVKGVVPTGMVFAGVWNGGRYAVQGQKLHSVTVPARDAVVLISVDGEAMDES